MSVSQFPDARDLERQLGLARYSDLNANAASMAEEFAAQQDALMRSSGVREVIEAQNRLVKSIQPTLDAMSAARSLIEPLRESIEAARAIGQLALPSFMEQYQLPATSLAAQWAEAFRKPWWHDYHLDLLNTHSAMASLLVETEFVRSSTLASMDSFLSEPLTGIRSVRQAREFLGISGLLHYPRYRRLSRSEKQQQIVFLIDDSSPAEHVSSAFSLNHRNEKVLRMAIDQCMRSAYGDDWMNERLPCCDCKKLLGKRTEDGESLLDHADFFHYTEIMCHPEHFDNAFSDTFENPADLRVILGRLRALRAKSFHARTFTPEDLREMAALWGLVAVVFDVLVSDVVIAQ